MRKEKGQGYGWDEAMQNMRKNWYCLVHVPQPIYNEQ